MANCLLDVWIFKSWPAIKAPEEQGVLSVLFDPVGVCKSFVTSHTFAELVNRSLVGRVKNEVRVILVSHLPSS